MYGIDTYLDFLYYLLTRTKIKVDKLRCIITYKDDKVTDFIRLDLQDISRANLIESIKDIEEGRQRDTDIVDISYLDDYKYIAIFDYDSSRLMYDIINEGMFQELKVPVMKQKEKYYGS